MYIYNYVRIMVLRGEEIFVKKKNLFLVKTIALVLGLLMILPVFVFCVSAEDEILLSDNYAFGKEVVVSSQYKNTPAPNAVDGDASTWWRSLPTDRNIYLIVPFGEEIEINRINLKLYSSGKMATVRLQYTTDANPSADSQWKDIKVYKDGEIASNISARFDTVKATAVRFRADVPAEDTYAGLYEIEVYNYGKPELFSENYALGSAVLHSSQTKDTPSPNAVDDDASTWWRSLSTDRSIYLIVPFGDGVDINRIFISLFNPENMSSAKLQYTTDANPSANSLWKDIKVYNAGEITSNISAKFDTVKATAVRFCADVPTEGTYAGLYEIEVYNYGKPELLSENYALGSAVAVSSQYKNTPAPNAVDGDASTWWRSLSTDRNIYLIVPFGDRIDINRIFISLFNPENMSSAKLQYTTDANPSANSQWKDIKVFEDADITKEISIRIDTVSATAIRFCADVPAEGTQAGIYEIEAYYYGQPKLLSENYALGSAVIHSSQTQATPSSKAVDGSASTWWRSMSTDRNIYLIVPFGEEIEINRINLKLYSSDKMATAKLQYTTDANPSANSQWKDIKVYNAGEITSNISAKFDTVNATAVRFYADVPTEGAYAGLYEIEVYNYGHLELLSENYALSKKVSANSQYSERPTALAVDGDVATWWRSLSSSTDDFIYLVVPFGKEIKANIVRMKLHRSEQMTAVKLQYTTDPSPSQSSEWLDIEVFDKDHIKDEMVVSFDTVRATGMRFYADLSTKPAGLFEFEVYYSDIVSEAVNTLAFPAFKEYSQLDRVDAEIVSIGDNGELIYADHDGTGGRLLDFSYCGYKRGEEEIPDVKVVKTIEPGDLADHTALIQGAIDEVAALPLEERGAILLRAGKYTVTGTLKINASGIVLRGEGQGENGTIIYDSRATASVSTLTVAGTGYYSYVSGTKTTLNSDYVASGVNVLPLSSVSKYKAGDSVLVVCTPNNLWVQTLGMDVIPGATAVQWEAGDYVMTYERVVTAVDETGGTITLDVGIPLTLDSQYYTATVEKIRDNSGRISECGVEDIRFVSYYNGEISDENHPYTAVSTSNCRNCWVRNVSAQHYYMSAITVGSRSINVTVDGCSYLEPISKVEGGRRYSFYMSNCQYALFKNCYSYDSRHDYVLNSRVCGPNVFLDSVAEDSNNGSEPHHRWSNGTLFDNIYQIGSIRLGYFLAINAGNNGTGHGWMGANTIFWNCLSPAILVGKPQTEQNFAVGAYGVYDITPAQKQVYVNKRYNKFTTPTIVTPNYPSTKDYAESPMYGTGYIESPYNPVNPSSLYKAQLSYRLYGDARVNVKPSAPILEYPRTDYKSDSHLVTFSGKCDINADKVFVYVGGEKHEIAVDTSKEYSLTLNLENGYYDVSVSQEIGGIESDRNASRTILVDAKPTKIVAISNHETENSIRFMSGVDSLEYSSVGFEVEVYANQVPGGAVVIEGGVVYKSVIANGKTEKASSFGYKYLAACSINGIDVLDGREYYIIVKPFARVGETRYYGSAVKIDIDSYGRGTFDENYIPAD